MSWTYSQATGAISRGGMTLGTGYSGHGEGRNNPAMEAVHDVGPIPHGRYSILSPRDTDTHGPYVLPLVPEEGTDTHGRAGFLIHGDSVKAPGTASHGCIILARAYRISVWTSGDHSVEVVS